MGTEAVEELSGKLGLDTTDYKAAVIEANRQIRVLESGFRASAAALEDWTKDSAGMESRAKALTDQIEIQRAKVAALKEQYTNLSNEGKTSATSLENMQIKVNQETEKLNKMEVELDKTSDRLADLKDNEDSAGKKTADLGNEEDTASAKTSSFKLSITDLKSAIELLGKAFEAVQRVAKGVYDVTFGAMLNLGKTIGKTFMDSATLADNFATLSGQTGISTTRLQEMDYIGKKLDVDLGTMTGSMEKMIRNMESAKKAGSPAALAFQELGVKVMDANGHLRDSQTVFSDSITALGNVQDETERDALAMQIFGKSAMDLNPLINAGGGQLRSLADEAHNVGAVMSADAVEGLDKFKDSADALQNGAKGMLGSLMASLLPTIQPLMGSFTGVMEKISGIFSVMKVNPHAAQLMVQQLIQDIVGAVPQFVQGGLSLLQGLGDAITAALPVLLPVAEQIITMLAQGLTSALSLWLQIGTSLLQGLISAITTSLPALLPMVVQIIQSIVKFLAQSLPLLIGAAVQIIPTLVKGALSMLPLLMGAGIQILLALVGGLLPQLPMLVQTALSMIITLATGITRALPVLIPTITNIIPQIILVLIQNLPLLIGAALQLILALARGLVLALPVLIPYLPKILQAIVNALIQALPLIGSAAVQIILTLVTGILDSLPMIADAAGQLVQTLVDGVAALGAELLQVGINIVEGIWQGMLARRDRFSQDVRDFFQKIISDVKKLLGIASPSAVFAEIGTNIALGLGGGFANAMAGVQKNVTGAMAGLAKAPSGGGLWPSGAAPAAAGAGAGVPPIVVQVVKDLDYAKLAAYVGREYQMRRR
jgi:phage-related protein